MVIDEGFKEMPNWFKGRVGARIHIYFIKYAKFVNTGQGNLSINCPELWNMTDKEFIETFGNIKLEK